MDEPGHRTVFTNCRTCSVACGVAVHVDGDDRVVRIAPDKLNPYTWHDFCAKGRTARDLVEHPRRIRTPMRRVGDRYVEASWDEAIDGVAAQLRSIADRHGPDSIASFLGYPGFMGSANSMFYVGFLDALGTSQRYWPGSMDQNNYHVVAEEMYGSPFLVLATDIDECDCFLLVGMNPAESAMSWLEVAPGGWRRVLQRQEQGADVVVVDPRRTPTAEKASLHLAVRPGQDWALLLGMVKVILESGLEHAEDCAGLTNLGALRALVADADLADLSARCDISADVITDVARRFATARTAMCVSHTGVAQHTTGTIGEWFGHVLNVITGRVDRPGGRRFERGYVDTIGIFAKLAPANDTKSRVRGLPSIAGYRSLAELPDEITTPGPGQVKAMIINGGNPVVSGPQSDQLDRALAQLDLLIAVDLVQRESHRHAHWLIPGVHWLERDDLFGLASQFQEQPFVQYSPRAINPPPGVLEEWQFFTDLALRMKAPMFGKPGVNAFIKATRAVGRVTRRPGLAFNPEWVNRLLVAMGRRVKWREIMEHPHGWLFAEKEFGNFAKVLRTPDKKVNVAPSSLVEETTRQLRCRPEHDAEYPLLLTDMRRKSMMNSHLMEQPSLHKGADRNAVEIHPDDAQQRGISTGDLVRVSSWVGAVELPATVTDAIRPGVLMIEHGWGSRAFDPLGGDQPEALGVNRNILVDNGPLDPLSITSPMNSQRVQVAKVV